MVLFCNEATTLVLFKYFSFLFWYFFFNIKREEGKLGDHEGVEAEGKEGEDKQWWLVHGVFWLATDNFGRDNRKEKKNFSVRFISFFSLTRRNSKNFSLLESRQHPTQYLQCRHTWDSSDPMFPFLFFSPLFSILFLCDFIHSINWFFRSQFFHLSFRPFPSLLSLGLDVLDQPGSASEHCSSTMMLCLYFFISFWNTLKNIISFFGDLCLFLYLTWKIIINLQINTGSTRIQPERDRQSGWTRNTTGFYYYSFYIIFIIILISFFLFLCVIMKLMLNNTKGSSTTAPLTDGTKSWFKTHTFNTEKSLTWPNQITFKKKKKSKETRVGGSIIGWYVSRVRIIS